MSSDLIPSISIAALVQARAAIMERIERARALLLEADEIAQASGLANTANVLCTGRGWMESVPLTSEDSMQHARRRLDASGWRLLMSESGMLSLMDAKARDEWRKQLDQAERGDIGADPVPELVGENIASTFGALHGERQQMFERGVVNVFKGLSWNYKANLPQKFGRRIVVRVGYWTGETDRLDDLDRVFHVLDKAPAPDHRSSFGALVSSAKSRDTRALVEGPFMAIRCFKKGTGHVTFKRPDLVEQINGIIARHFPGALPEPRA